MGNRMSGRLAHCCNRHPDGGRQGSQALGPEPAAPISDTKYVLFCFW